MFPGKKKLIVAGLLLVICFLSGLTFAGEKTYTLRFNTVGAPKQPVTLAMYKFAEIVEKLSGGKITVKVFHSGQLGNQKTGPLSVARGSLEMAVCSPSWMADLFDYPEVGVLEAAYLYRDLDHAYMILNGPVGKKFWDHLAKNAGIRVLDSWLLGTRELNLTKKAGPVRRPEDLKGIKLRMPNVEAWLDVGRALGANPTPLGFGEVYMALKTGTIDGQDNPLPTDEAAKFYEVTHYIVLTDHIIGFVQPIINEKLWQDMPEKYRMWVEKAITAARFYCDSLVLEQEATLLAKFEKEYGMEIIIPDKEAFREHARKFYSQPKFEKKWGRGMYEKIQSMYIGE